MQAWADYLDRLRADQREACVTDVEDRRANVSAQLDNPAQGQNNPRKSAQRRDTTASQLELFSSSGGK